MRLGCQVYFFLPSLRSSRVPPQNDTEVVLSARERRKNRNQGWRILSGGAEKGEGEEREGGKAGGVSVWWCGGKEGEKDASPTIPWSWQEAGPRGEWEGEDARGKAEGGTDGAQGSA
jgi:hypothetical protein